MKEKTNSTGIMINGNDHYVSNTIVFSSRVGVAITGAADILNGVHTWNCATGNGGIGILNQSWQTRFEGCYLDYNDLILDVARGGAQETTVADGFFLGGGQLVFKATTPKDTVQSVAVTGNEWGGTGAPPFAVDESAGKIVSVTDFQVFGSLLSPNQPYAGPTATLYAAPQASDTWTFNFTSALLFPSVPIEPSSIDVQLISGSTAAPSSVPAAVASYSAPSQVVTVFAPGTGGNGYSVRVSVSQSVFVGA